MSDRPIDRNVTALVEFVRHAPGLPGHCVMHLIRQGVARRDAEAAFRRAIDAGRLVSNRYNVLRAA